MLTDSEVTEIKALLISLQQDVLISMLETFWRSSYQQIKLAAIVGWVEARNPTLWAVLGFPFSFHSSQKQLDALQTVAKFRLSQ